MQRFASGKKSNRGRQKRTKLRTHDEKDLLFGRIRRKLMVKAGEPTSTAKNEPSRACDSAKPFFSINSPDFLAQTPKSRRQFCQRLFFRIMG
jgi:hypothetical protein